MQYQKLHAGRGREAIILQVMALYSGLLVIKICMYTDSIYALQQDLFLHSAVHDCYEIQKVCSNQLRCNQSLIVVFVTSHLLQRTHSC